MINKSQKDGENNEEEPGKLFIGGLSWETTEEKLQQYFSEFGEVIDSVVMKNNESGQSRGFGFVTFAEPNCVDKVLAKGTHLLDGRAIDPKPCSTKAAIKSKKNSQYPKVFLGGLPFNVTETDLRQIFSRYGEVMDVIIMYDHEKNKCRGFGFLSFEKEEEVSKCVADHYIYVNGKKVEVKRAEPRDGRSSSQSQWPSMPNGPGMDPSRTAAAMPNYQGWGAAPAAGYGQYTGYGTPPGAPVPYGGWGGPPPQWGPGYPGSGYPPYGGPQPPYAGWNWNVPPQPPAGPPPAVGAPPANGAPPPAVPPNAPPDAYGRPPVAPPVTPNAAAPTAAAAAKPPQDYANYGGYAGYAPVPPDGYNAGVNRPYADASAPVTATAESYSGAPGPQRNSQSQQGYHPYRRV